MDPTLELPTCPLGCPMDDEVVLTARDRLHGLPGEFSVVRCRGCGLMRTSPRPRLEAIAGYYPEDYSPHQPAPRGVFEPKTGMRSRVARLLSTQSEALPTLDVGAVLEVACGSGAHLARLRDQGWHTVGVEPSPQAAASARSLGLEIHEGTLATFESDSRFDLAVGWMAIEHFHDLIGDLRRMHDLVVPGGWLAASVPDAGSWEFRAFTDRWFALQVPTHLQHFTPATLTRVLSASGWHVRRIIHQRTLANAIASIGYVAADRGVRASIADRLVHFPERRGRASRLLAPFEIASGILGLSGRLTVWAQRT